MYSSILYQYPPFTRETKISLIFPPSFLSPSEVLSELRGYASHRILKHRKGFLFMDAHRSADSTVHDHSCVNLIYTHLCRHLRTIFPAIIPNLPFFFCAWRSWSHYRGIYCLRSSGVLVSNLNSLIAYRSSQYLQSLLEHNLIVPEASESLDEVYKIAPTNNPLSILRPSLSLWIRSLFFRISNVKNKFRTGTSAHASAWFWSYTPHYLALWAWINHYQCWSPSRNWTSPAESCKWTRWSLIYVAV